jgi:hypothetical protein
LHWLVQIKSVIDTLVHYLDYFIFVGEAITNDFEIPMNTFLKISEELGVPMAENKTVHLTTVLTFLGLEIDKVLMVVRIPSCKLLKLKSYIEESLIRRNVKHRFVDSAVGLLSFCTRAIPSDRAFVRRFYDLLSSGKVKKPFYLIRITQEVKSDALVLLNVFNYFNGECYIPEQLWLTNEAVELFTDSAGNVNLGCGAYFAGHWIQFKWPES